MCLCLVCGLSTYPQQTRGRNPDYSAPGSSWEQGPGKVGWGGRGVSLALTGSAEEGILTSPLPALY